jgi:lipid-A-disaccharide synthase
MDKPKIFFSVGERSGDLIAAGLIGELGDKADAYGVCGPQMLLQGCKQVEDMAKFQAFGVTEVIRKLPGIVGRFSQLISEVERIRPDVAVLVDGPGFHFQVAERLKNMQIPVVQLVAPKLWAWGASRVKRLNRDFAKVLGILPFEEEFFKSHGVPYQYIGCPVVDRVENVRTKLKGKTLSGCYAALPGSRLSEWGFFLPFFQEFLQFNQSKNIRWIIPVAENLNWQKLQTKFKQSLDDIDKIECTAPAPELASLGLKELRRCGPVSFVQGSSLEVMSLAEACLVASGTVALESALLQKKTVVVYKVDNLTYRIAKSSVKIKYASLPNLALDRALLKEHLQHFSVEEVSRSLFDDPMDVQGYQSLVDCFGPMDYARCTKEVLELTDVSSP